MTDSHSKKLIISGSIYTVIIVLWPVFMLLGADTAGTTEQKLVMLGQNGTIYYTGFVFASLIAPAIFFLIAILSGLYRKENLSFFDILGVIFLAAYAILNSISYISQYSILPNLLSAGEFQEAANWFFGNTTSLAYFFNQLGYCMFGIAVMFIFREFLKARGLTKATGILLYASGVLSIAAFIGLLLKSEVLNMSTMISGFLVVPLGVLAIISGIKKG